ncbi:hypothetical protein GF389_05460 [Candidatus Dojkabacteria bacterium]|nr:hypothetical protein [Candidatus Dojkabacteria bacterium]
MKIVINYSKSTKKFFRKNSAILTKDKTRKLLIKAANRIALGKETNIDLTSLKGNHSGFYRIRYRKVRILFAIKEGEVVVIKVAKIDFRGNTY